MALSLVCDDCGARLKSVQECQQHQDLTGHLAFSESTAAVLNIVCEACGKPCRSETEQDLHTKRTGHTNFVNKTDEAKVLDTEAEMRVEQAALKQEDAMRPSEASEAMEVLEERVPPAVDVELRQQLENMGFSANKATRALYFSGTSTVEQAITWIMEHEDDADLDEPLLVPKEKPKLDPEEAKKQAAEMLRKAKDKREKEERELERLREQERVRAGKELLQAKRQEDELRLKRNLEERRREKEDEARARDRIRQKLAEDRAERRRKLGLPELTPEQLAAEDAKEAAEKAGKAKAKTAMGPLPVKPVSVAEKVRAVLVAMKKGANDEAALKTCWSTLLKYCGNVARDPGNEKYRKINTANAAFQSRVASQEGAIKVLELAGFVADAGSQTLELAQDKVSIDVLNTVGAELHNAQNNPFFGML